MQIQVISDFICGLNNIGRMYVSSTNEQSAQYFLPTEKQKECKIELWDWLFEFKLIQLTGRWQCFHTRHMTSKYRCWCICMHDMSWSLCIFIAIRCINCQCWSFEILKLTRNVFRSVYKQYYSGSNISIYFVRVLCTLLLYISIINWTLDSIKL